MRNKILMVGAAIVDVLVTPAEASVFETGSYPAEQIQMSFGGDAMNEAAVLASLGKNVYLNTVFGDDPQGEMIQNHCKKLGIHFTEGCVKEHMQTGINVVLVQENGERNFLTNRNGSLRKLCAEDIVSPIPEDVAILCYASIFVSPEMAHEELAAVLGHAKAQGILTFADMTKRKNGETVEDIRGILQNLDYLIPNEEEAYLVTGADTPETAADILQKAGVKNVIIKCGKRGCYVLGSGSEGYYVPAVEGVACIDTTGAGDSFSAGFIYGISEGWSLETCAAFANQCGAKAVESIGATTWCEEMKCEIIVENAQ